GGARTRGPGLRVRRQLGGALVERGARCEAAAGPRPAGRALQVGGDGLVKPRRRLGGGPGAAGGGGAGRGGGGGGEGLVGAPAVLGRGRTVDRGAHERMAKAHLRAELDQAGVGGRGRRSWGGPQRGGPP